MTKSKSIFDYIGEGIWLLFGGEPLSEPSPKRRPQRDYIPTEEQMPKVMTAEERAKFVSDRMRESIERVGKSLHYGIKKAEEKR